ncbi:MAG TPA: tetratricopeptide repeat protein, partial [Opitutus sp.]|nr:tetratricopeptide repeat protein [Opitutus sp.]
ALWRRVVELAPDYTPARLRLGDSLLKNNRLDEAAATYAAVLERDHDNAYAQLGLARIDLEAERWTQARERLETVVRATNYELGYDLIVSLYERLGQADRALAIRGSAKAFGSFRDPVDPWLDALLDLCYDPYRISLAAGIAARSGDPARGRALLERAIELAPGDISTRFQLGTLSLQQGDTTTAREQFERCTILAPDFSDGWAQLSALQAKLGDSAGAARTLATGLRHCPDSPGLHLMQARTFRQAGRIEEAINEFMISINLRPNEPEAFIELGSMLVSAGRTDEGMEQLRRSLETDPANPMALSILAFHAISTRNEAEADQWMSRIAEQPRVSREQASRIHAAYRQQF